MLNLLKNAPKTRPNQKKRSKSPSTKAWCRRGDSMAIHNSLKLLDSCFKKQLTPFAKRTQNAPKIYIKFHHGAPKHILRGKGEKSMATNSSIIKGNYTGQEKRSNLDRRATERRQPLGLYQANRIPGRLYAADRRIEDRRTGIDRRTSV